MTRIIKLLLALVLMPLGVQGQQQIVSFQEFNEKLAVFQNKFAIDPDPVTSTLKDWGLAGSSQEQWYMVDQIDLTISERIKVTGNVSLILCDGKKLNAEKGIEVPSGSTLTIYAQSSGTTAGVLEASGYSDYYEDPGGDVTNYYGAAIGGACEVNTSVPYPTDCGTIIIHGGQITANSENIFYSAGIGGCQSDGGTVKIYGGIINATGGYDCDGIGQGEDYSGNACLPGTLTLGPGVSCYGDNSTNPPTTLLATGLVSDVSSRFRYMKTTGPTLYNLTIEDKIVSSVNASDVLGDGTVNTAPTVSYNASTNTLTLNGINVGYSTTYNGNYIESDLETLNVDLLGENKIYCTGAAFFNNYSGSADASLFFKSSDTYFTSFNVYDNGTLFSGFNDSNISFETGLEYDATSRYISTISYQLWIGSEDQFVTYKNKDNITHDLFITTGTDGKVSFDPVEHVLTLKNATITGSGIRWDEIEDLTIKVIGNNYITPEATKKCIYSDGTSSPSITFERGDANNACELTLTTTNSQPDVTPVIQGFINFDNPNLTNMFWIPKTDLSNITYSATIISAPSFSGGSGTTNDPFLIKTTSDLKDMATFVNRGADKGFYQLAVDTLDCSGMTDFVSIGYYPNFFNGTFDGANHTIKGIKYNPNYIQSSEGIGFFGNFGGTVKDLTLKDCTFGGGYCNGAIANFLGGTADNCTIESCTIESDGTGMIGGIAGYVWTQSLINNCSIINDTIKNGQGMGGVAAYTEAAAIIQNCTVDGGEITTNQNSDLGGIVGSNSANVYNCIVKGVKISGGSGSTAGAIVSGKTEYEFFEHNYYYGDVTVTVGTTTKSGYTQRGIGNMNDITENDSIALYTKPLTLPTDANFTIAGVADTYYSANGNILNVAPGQTAQVLVTPQGAYLPTSATATYTPTGGAELTIMATKAADSYTYSFVMPDNAATFNLTSAIDLENANITYEIDDAYYTGTAVVPTTVKATGIPGATGITELTKDTHFTITQYVLNGQTVTSPIDAGTYTVTIEGMGSYTGTKEVNYNIINAYDLWIAGTKVTDKNKDAIITDATTGNATVTFDGDHTLTLNGASIDGAIESGIGNLTIHFTGTNRLKDNGKVTNLIKSTNNGILTFETDAIIQNGTGIYFNDMNGNAFGNNSINGFSSVVYEAGLGYDASFSEIKETLFIEYNSNRFKLHSSNKDDIVGDGGSVKYNYDSTNGHVLTLNNANIEVIEWNIDEELTIALNGTCSIINTNHTYAINYSGNLNIVKASGASSALLSTETNGYPPIESYGLSLGSGLYWKPIAQYSTIITEDPNFIVVDGYVINDGQPVNGTTGKIEYSANDNTLTLTDYQETFGSSYSTVNAIETGIVGLKVKLLGTNNVTCQGPGAYAFKGLHTNASIEFVSDGSGNLVMNTNNTTNAFNGFGDGKVTYNGMGCYESGDHQWTIDVLPAAPSIAYINNHTYLDTDEIEITTLDYNPTIFYTWGNATIGTIYTHDTSNPTLIEYDDTKRPKAQENTLRAWAGKSIGSNKYLMSEETVQAFTVSTDISNYYVDLPTNATYTGSAFEPVVKESMNATSSLQKGQDYNIKYEKDVNGTPTEVPSMVDAGTYTITINGTGDYGGTNVVNSFQIGKATDNDITTVPIAETDLTYTGNPLDLIATEGAAKYGNVVYCLTENGTYGAATDIKGTDATTYTIYYKVIGTDNYSGVDARSITATIKERTAVITFADGLTYQTYYSATEDCFIPDGVTAYILTEVSGTSVITKKVSYLKAGEPLLLEKTAGSTIQKDPTESFDGNLLRYAFADVSTTGNEFVLYNNEFVKATGTIPSDKCYLDVSGPAVARKLSIAHGDDDTVGIDDVMLQNDSENERWYDLQGRRINKPKKAGTYILNGKIIMYNNK